MSRFILALRLLWRDLRSGELTLLLSALLLAVTASTAITVFSDRLQRTLLLQTAEFIAADLAIASDNPIPTEWLDKASQLALNASKTIEFPSVLIENDELLLTNIKAVSAGYPLRGALKILSSDQASESLLHHGPEAGTTWVDARVLSALKLQLGDSLSLGDKTLLITHTLTYEPDKQANLYSFAPRVMIKDSDLSATGMLQPGSHVHYHYQFIGDVEALKLLSQWLKPQLNPTQRLMDVHDDRPEIGSLLDKVQRYLGLSSLLVVIVAGVAIAMATQRYSERHFDNAALLRCLGCRQREILALFAGQFFLLGVLASSLGSILGWIAQYGLMSLLASLLPKPLAEPSLLSISFGFMIGFALLLGFALPPLLRLQHVSPLRVLRRDLEPLTISAWLSYTLALSLVAWLLWKYTQNLAMTALLLSMGAASLLIIGLLIQLLLTMLQKYLPHMRLVWRMGLQGLTRNRATSIGQILAFCTILFTMLLSFTVRNDLVRDWQQQLPDQAPNQFALNIFPHQLESVQQALAAQQIQSNHFYPVVRGRLVAINNVSVEKSIHKANAQADNAIHRELSLTWTEQLPEGNKITAGNWWLGDKAGRVSVEQKLAESLGIKLGDQLSFTVTGKSFQADVVSIRALHWDSLKPNFYMIFSPGTLDGFASTYLSSFYLAPSQKPLLTSLIKQYPNMTVMDVDHIVQQFKTLLLQTTQALNYLLLFALMAAIAVLIAAVQSSLDRRIHENAILRALGANRQLLRSAHLIEFGFLGGLSGALAVILAEGFVFALYTGIMDMPYQPKFYLWIVTPLLGATIVGLVGFLNLKKVLDQPPLKVLSSLV